MKWQAKLNKKEMKHLKESTYNGRPTLKALQRNVLYSRSQTSCCWECRSIARKLGLTVPEF